MSVEWKQLHRDLWYADGPLGTHRRASQIDDDRWSWTTTHGYAEAQYGEAGDVAEAMRRADAAAVSLLVEALASVPVDADWHLVRDPSLGLCVEATDLDGDNYARAISLARALITAAVQARKESNLG